MTEYKPSKGLMELKKYYEPIHNQYMAIYENNGDQLARLYQPSHHTSAPKNQNLILSSLLDSFWNQDHRQTAQQTPPKTVQPEDTVPPPIHSNSFYF